MAYPARNGQASHAPGVVESAATETGISLKPVGDDRGGYGVEILYGGRLVARHRHGGEITMTVETTLHTLAEVFEDWKPARVQASPDGKKIVLSGEMKSVAVGARVGATITFEVVTPHVVRKSISLEHRYGPKLYYRIANALEPVRAPSRYWTFADGDNGAGGVVREPFPALGFDTADAVSVGLLTDNGARNCWTRADTQFDLDTSKGLISIPRVPDEALTSLATAAERAGGEHHVTLRLGEVHRHDVPKDGKPSIEAYHPLARGQEDTRTFFIFADTAGSHRERKVNCQIRLADGLGFEGTAAEKILFADLQMLTWIDEPDCRKAYPVPSIGYQFFYQRDAFWMVSATLDESVARETWELVKTTQDESGGVCCHALPYRWHQGMPGGGTDANLHWIVWAHVNRVRYGIEPDRAALERNLDWVRKTFCTGRPGEYWSRSGGWFDVFSLPEPVLFTHMQGEFAVALRCARELGLEVRDAELLGATLAYRDSFEEERGYFPFARRADLEIMLSPTVLLPEFMSLWLFDEPMLPDASVCRHLDAIDRTWNRRVAGGFAVPNIIRSDGTFQTRENKMFAPSLWWEPGIYHNGGSFLLYEYLAYASGYRHGWIPAHVGESALERMARRLELEFSEEMEPVSHEFIPLTRALDTPGAAWDGSSDEGVPGPPGSKVFGWNAFVIIANEVIGLRPAHDPIVLKNLAKRR